ncbi:MAG: alpha/beta hydrolase family protein [Persicimonas sp.]
MSILDRAVDHAIARLTGIPKMFYEGWGDSELLEELVDRGRNLGPIADIEVRWLKQKQARGGGHLFEGWFTTPASYLPLPAEARAAYFQMMLPENPFEEPKASVCVHLAGTGDATYIGRRLLARPLLEKNIGAIILQSPYYGPRRPEWQSGTRLRNMTDMLMLNIAAIEEARSLVKWARREGFARMGVSGFSMGGTMAAFAAQSIPFAVAAIPCATGDTSVDPLVESPLRNICDWDVLAEEAGGPDEANMLMHQTLSSLALSEHGNPVLPEAAIIVGCRDDEFISTEDVLALHRHWQGAELRWIDAGHTTGWLMHGDEIRSAIADAFERLPD